ncbi:MAG: TetR/AcrR family transcriptional regulator [Lachnospiraceae bacterium]|nr:TetR/AcrR family transcriptional regulator [Lachnospiraceae bacterium]
MDKRIVRTKRLLRRSLLDLISRESYDKITVTKICLNAGIGRGTFYTYYSDKNVLLVDCFKEMREATKAHFHQLQLSNNKANDLMPAVINLIEALKTTSGRNSDKKNMLIANGYIQSEYFRYVSDMMIYFEDLYSDVLTLRYDRDRLNAFIAMGVWGFMNIKSSGDEKDTMKTVMQLLQDLSESNLFVTKA